MLSADEKLVVVHFWLPNIDVSFTTDVYRTQRVCERVVRVFIMEY